MTSPSLPVCGWELPSARHAPAFIASITRDVTPSCHADGSYGAGEARGERRPGELQGTGGLGSGTIGGGFNSVLQWWTLPESPPPFSADLWRGTAGVEGRIRRDAWGEIRDKRRNTDREIEREVWENR